MRNNSRNYINRGNRHNHSGYRPHSGGAKYVWRVEWYSDFKTNKCYRSFSNRHQALFFISKLETNFHNHCISLDKWDGSLYL